MRSRHARHSCEMGIGSINNPSTHWTSVRDEGSVPVERSCKRAMGRFRTLAKWVFAIEKRCRRGGLIDEGPPSRADPLSPPTRCVAMGSISQQARRKRRQSTRLLEDRTRRTARLFRLISRCKVADRTEPLPGGCLTACWKSLG